MLLVGASAADAPAWGGALAFTMNSSPLWADWIIGSAFIYIMLIAGASVNSASACGALTFCVDVPPSYALWVAGSAY